MVPVIHISYSQKEVRMHRDIRIHANATCLTDIQHGFNETVLHWVAFNLVSDGQNFFI